MHQRQVDALTKLYVGFHQMNDLLRGAIRGVKPQGEMDHFEKWQQKAEETRFEYIEHKIILNEAIVARIEELFENFWKVGIAIRIAPILREGERRMEAAAKEIEAKEIADKLIPPLLVRIESEARKVIRDECSS